MYISEKKINTNLKLIKLLLIKICLPVSGTSVGLIIRRI